MPVALAPVVLLTLLASSPEGSVHQLLVAEDTEVLIAPDGREVGTVLPPDDDDVRVLRDRSGNTVGTLRPDELGDGQILRDNAGRDRLHIQRAR